MAMWIRQLDVTDCAGIAKASVALEPGLNVLHGPNELGKSTLAKAIRAALLLPATATMAEALRSWEVDAVPDVSLTFEQEAQRIYRLRKRFGTSGTYLEFSRDGGNFTQESRGREVEGRLAEILRWGIEPPGGKRGQRGMPSSFITTALLGEQDAIGDILQASLDGDPSDSGRVFLTEALQALAEDPRFKEVLASTQAKVDEAFTRTGRRSSGRASPWTKLREERNTAEQRDQNIRLQVEQSEAAREQVRELDRRLSEAETEAEQAATALKTARKREAATHALAKAEERLREAKQQVRRVEEQQAAVKATEKNVEELRKDHAAIENALKELEPRANAARGRVLQLRSEDAEQGRQLRFQEAKNKCLLLQQQAADLAARVKQAEMVAAQEKAVVAKNTDIDKQAETLAEQRKLLADARSATEADKRRLTELARERDCVCYRLALAEAEKRKAELAAMRKQAATAKELAGGAEQKRTEAKALHAPAEAELKHLRQLHQERRVARAKLAVGLTVDFTPQRPGSAEVGIDGEARKGEYAAGERLAYQAERELRLAIEGVGVVEVRGGSRDLHHEAQAANERWRKEAEPIFARAGLDPLESIEALEAKAEQAADFIAEAVKLASEAQQARMRCEGIDDVERAAAVAVAEVKQRRSAIDDWLAEDSLDDALSARDDGRSEEAIAEEAQALEKEMSKRDALCIKLDIEVQLGDAALATAREDLAKAQQKLADCLPEDENWRRLLAEGDSEQQKLAGELTAQEAAIAAIRSEATAEAEQAEAEAAKLEQELQAKHEERDELAERLKAKEVQLASLRGEAKTLEGAAESLDIAALQAERDEQAAVLAALPAQESDPSTDVDDLERCAKDAKSTAATVRNELATAQGALSQVGGQSIEEQAAEAKEALAALGRREHELEVDYGAWQLLRDTLTEAEKEDAAHLGDALVKPVSERMSALTKGRYEAIGIGPQLDATGILLGGEERDFGDVSVGTREQIALLLRLSIAEALGSFLILDDHLTQSDPDRMAWIRELLGKAAKNIQVVVMTCHPNAYVTGNEHAVDLERCITRHTANG